MLLFVQLSAVCAQTSTRHQALYWTRYYLRWEVTQNISIHGEADNRRFFQPFGGQHQFIAHLHAHRRLGPAWEAWLGATLSLVYAQQPGVAHKPLAPEYRPWQAVSFQHKIPKGMLSHRLRWEERWMRRTSPEGLAPGFRFYFRARYACSAQIPLGARLSLKAGDEVMVQAGAGLRQAFDQNRLWGGLDFSWGKKRYNVELLYVWLWQQSTSGEMFYDRDVVRLTLGQRVF